MSGLIAIPAVRQGTSLVVWACLFRVFASPLFCGFEKCREQKYFLKIRSDQEFCSTKCRGLHHVIVWRSDPKNAERERKAARRKRRADKRSA